MTTTTKIFMACLSVLAALVFWASFAGWGLAAPAVGSASARHGSIRTGGRTHLYAIGK